MNTAANAVACAAGSSYLPGERIHHTVLAELKITDASQLTRVTRSGDSHT